MNKNQNNLRTRLGNRKAKCKRQRRKKRKWKRTNTKVWNIVIFRDCGVFLNRVVFAVLELPFSSEEAHGRFVDMNELYTRYFSSLLALITTFACFHILTVKV